MKHALLMIAMIGMVAPVGAQETTLDEASVENFANLALACVHQEYPNKIGHVMNSDDDLDPPRKLTPSFYGCFDWHSSVHGHWLLTRLAKLYPDADFAARARTALGESFTDAKIAGEMSYFKGEGRTSTERPYGLAWLLCLADELHTWDDEQAELWRSSIAPLEGLAADRFREWLPKLFYPIRTGEHSQTAFAFGLVMDWARTVGDEEMVELVSTTARRFYLDDTSCPLGYEPSGQDFLSPCIAEADLMRRVLPPAEFADWLSSFLPAIPSTGEAGWLPIGVVTDRTDGKLAHLDGLNISRAWMLEGIASGLPESDPRRAALQAAADVHSESGLASVTGDHYEGGHWLGSFATYLVTKKGL